MAIRRISRIQHRRGLKSDLPPKLQEGEIGWCLDTRELFIGNNDAFGANTQILTQWTPGDQLKHAYQGSTGVPALSVDRTIGAKIDDVVSVKDYGAKGNGVDDDHQAIQNAILDRYAKSAANGFSPLSGYVTIWLPAGTYRITDGLDLYPFVRLQGEGPNRTKIILDSQTVRYVMRTVDSNGSADANIGVGDGVVTYPTDIDLVDLWIDQGNPNGDAIRLQRASRVSLDRVKITGIKPSTISNQTYGIKIESLGGIYIPSNVTINSCEISGLGHAVYSDDPVKFIRIDMSDINNCWHGVTLGAGSPSTGPVMSKITNTVFRDIESTGIACYSTNLGTISSANTFMNVGLGVEPPAYAIYWAAGSNGCASIADQFDDAITKKIADNNPGKNVIVGPQQVSISTYTPNLIGPINLLDNRPTIPVDTDLTYDPAQYNTIHIDYSMNRSTSKRTGRLTILTDGTNSVLQDEFTTLGTDLGVNFGYRMVHNVIANSNTVIVTYTTTITGSNATMRYTENKWLS